MPYSLYTSIIDQICSLKPEITTLHLAGEPLLHSGIHEFVSYAAQKNLQTTFSTNATLLTETISEKLIQAGLTSVRIDFHPDRQFFESICVNAKWEDVRDNIKSLVALKRELKSRFPVVVVQMLSKTSGIKEIDADLDELKACFGEEQPDLIEPFFLHSWAGEYARNSQPGPGEKGVAAMSSPEHPRPCSHLWSSFVICWDGLVVPCCRDINQEMVLGDVKKQTIRDIWSSSEYILLRRMHSSHNHKDVPLCRSCSKPFEDVALFKYAIRYVRRSIDRTFRSISTRKLSGSSLGHPGEPETRVEVGR